MAVVEIPSLVGKARWEFLRKAATRVAIPIGNIASIAIALPTPNVKSEAAIKGENIVATD